MLIPAGLLACHGEIEVAPVDMCEGRAARDCQVISRRVWRDPARFFALACSLDPFGDALHVPPTHPFVLGFVRLPLWLPELEALGNTADLLVPSPLEALPLALLVEAGCMRPALMLIIVCTDLGAVLPRLPGLLFGGVHVPRFPLAVPLVAFRIFLSDGVGIYIADIVREVVPVMSLIKHLWGN